MKQKNIFLLFLMGCLFFVLACQPGMTIPEGARTVVLTVPGCS